MASLSQLPADGPRNPSAIAVAQDDRPLADLVAVVLALILCMAYYAAIAVLKLAGRGH